MNSGFNGTFVIPWWQTEMDGQNAAPVAEISPGRSWSWSGSTMRVDGAESILPLGAFDGQDELRKRAGMSVRRLLAPLVSIVEPLDLDALNEQLYSGHFTVTDGRMAWDVGVVPTGINRKPLLMFHGEIPPKDTELWIVRHNLDQRVLNEMTKTSRGVICFTPGTMIKTDQGPRDVASLCEGDRVQTKDNGLAEILWMGHKFVSSSRLDMTPDLRPVRLRAGALDKDVPDEGLLVSPDHRLLLRGSKARVLFNVDEVLVSARDLVNDHSIIRDHAIGSVHYIHMMLANHEIVFANNVATETFHPASASFETMRPSERDRMFDQLPELRGDVLNYGGYARRLLSSSDAAILKMG